MLDLDEGLCPVTYRLLARSKQALGGASEALPYYRAEVDAASLATICFLDAPRTTSIAAEIQRRAARQHGFSLVDLPDIFGRIETAPGQRLFADYCHLTVEGMKWAMASVAEKTLELDGRPKFTGDWPEPEISDENEATALFGAAIHGAHRHLPNGSKTASLEFWCEKALAKSSGVQTAMLDLVQARRAPCPAVLTSAQTRNLDSPYRLMLQHGWKYDYLDADLILAIRSVLGTRDPALADRVDRMLIDGLAVTMDRRELLPFFIWDPLEQCFPDVMRADDLTPRAYYRAHWPESSFCIVWAGNGSVALDLVMRCPEMEASEGSVKAAIRVNGKPVGVVDVQNVWTKTAIRLRRRIWSRV